jgi:hypothetical protein
LSHHRHRLQVTMAADGKAAWMFGGSVVMGTVEDDAAEVAFERVEAKAPPEPVQPAPLPTDGLN